MTYIMSVDPSNLDGSNHLYSIVIRGNPKKLEQEQILTKTWRWWRISIFSMSILGAIPWWRSQGLSVSWWLTGRQTFGLPGVYLAWSLAGGSAEHHLSEPSDHQLAGPGSATLTWENHGKSIEKSLDNDGFMGFWWDLPSDYVKK